MPLSLILAISIASTTFVEHAKITLEVTPPKGESVTAYVDQTPPEHGKNPRPMVTVKAGEPIKIQYILTNIYPNKTLENVVVHFYVGKQEKVGQKSTPDLGIEANVVLESACEMDFKPGAKSGARTTLKVDQPGVYLIRVESKQTQSDHEHFAAIDLVVEGAKR